MIGDILSRFEHAGLKVVAAKLTRLDKQRAESFYEVHRERPFFNSLTDYISTGPIFVSVLEGDGAIAKNREIMGATDPAKAAPGNDPEGLGHQRGGERRARVRRPRDRGRGDRILLHRRRDPVVRVVGRRRSIGMASFDSLVLSLSKGSGRTLPGSTCRSS
ncbi:Nucleoside diphosphate kinase [Geodia barretti]|uniref:nucleoside-diphosphate kinase n=1 Tax=Geodia barretti TaxID=519541 RepID=A0AA35RQK4_GEOBA|nr:Nucleoside diphosphate kinase [Geodia barretti]